MSSLYEDELNRLLKEKKARLRLLKRGAKRRDADLLKADIDVLEAALKHYRKALERFRVKPDQPSPSQGASTSQAS